MLKSPAVFGQGKVSFRHLLINLYFCSGEETQKATHVESKFSIRRSPAHPPTGERAISTALARYAKLILAVGDDGGGGVYWTTLVHIILFPIVSFYTVAS